MDRYAGEKVKSVLIAFSNALIAVLVFPSEIYTNPDRKYASVLDLSIARAISRDFNAAENYLVFK